MSEQRRPNVVMIVSDDQGAWAWGRPSGGVVETPHLDALADRGTVLDRFFCVSPVCSPARASLFTGRPPSWHGVHDWLKTINAGPESVDFLAGQDLVTEALGDAGYRVGLSGKWHLGASDVMRPGFSHWFALDGGGTPYDGGLFHRARPDGSVESGRIEGYVTDTIADDAIGFITDSAGRDEPFCSLVTFTAPHSPWTGQHPEPYVAPHRGRDVTGPDGVPVSQEPPHPWLATRGGHPNASEADPDEAKAGYFGAIAAMDAAVGRILDTLQRQGVLDDTIVVFTSDNGFNVGHHGLWGKGNGSWPLNMYDSSVLVPFLAAGPGIARGQSRTDLVSAYDVAETLCELTGTDASRFADGPGQSFAGLLSGSEGARGDVVVHDEYGGTRMVRTERWKYVHRTPDGPHELYDLVADPAERRNLVDEAEHATTRDQLATQLTDWVEAHAHPQRRINAEVVSGSGQITAMVPGPGEFSPGLYDQWDH